MSATLYVLLLDAFFLWLPTAVAVVAVLVGLRFFDWWLLKRHSDLGSEKKLPRQLAMLALTGVAIAVVLLTLPLEDSTRNQLLAILGLIATAIMELSSTTLVANAMPSVMLRTTKSIRTGDYLRVGEHFGRVTERGLMHTEANSNSPNQRHTVQKKMAIVIFCAKVNQQVERTGSSDILFQKSTVLIETSIFGEVSTHFDFRLQPLQS